MAILRLIFFAITGIFFITQVVYASHVPAPKGFVNDFAGVLGSDDIASLEVKLSDYEKQSGNEISIALIKTLGDEDLNDYAVRVFEEWKIGKKNKDNGILVLAAIEDRQLRIEVGYGLEPLLTDGETGRIIRDVIVPAFQKNNYYAGLQQGVDAITVALGTDTEPIPQKPWSWITRNTEPLLYAFFFLFMYIPAFLARSKSIWAGGVIGGVIGVVVGLFMASVAVGAVSVLALGGLGILLDWLLSRNYEKLKKEGKETDWWHSGGGFYGGKSGGFGGFGGGRSGGGGASGRW